MPSASPALRHLLQQPLTSLRGVGPRRAALLAEALGLRTVGELLRCLPRRYEAPPPLRRLAEVADGERVRVRVRVRSTSLWRRGRRSTLSLRIDDASGAGSAVYFNQPYLRDSFPAGRLLLLEGRAARRRGLTLFAPRVLAESDLQRSVLVPVYAETDGLPRALLARAVAAALALDLEIPDALPPQVRAAAGVPDLGQALRSLHAPADLAAAETGRRRLAWEEILALERRRRSEPAVPTRRATQPRVWERIRARLPFALTADQQRALAVLRADLDGGAPLRRLLHGEVGSGKTALAFALSLALAVEGGQTALLAPTEILARQHLATFRRWLHASQLHVIGLLGDDTAAARAAALDALTTGRAHIAIGTHALYGREVHFARLQLVIFDEQHRFGVRQKAALLAKGAQPHVLTMTATPIPRTLAWARYGALEPIELRARPAAGATVRTQVRPLAEWPATAAALLPRLRAGERAFVVYPRIDGPAGLLAGARALLQGPWSGLSAVLIHGRMPGAEVEAAVERFRRGHAQVLLGTTVVEVGLDVPDVPLMCILEAQRLGLASLHQLRGRLCRGAGARSGACWMFAEAASQPRLRVLEACADGFSVAREDLRQRGPGALHGLRQHGRADFSAFDPERDEDLLECLRRPEVQVFLAAGPAASDVAGLTA